MSFGFRAESFASWIRFSALVLVNLFVPILLSQTGTPLETLPSTGISAMASYSHSDIDSVDLSSGNVNLHIPLISFPQLGNALKMNFIVRYNAPQWYLAVYNNPQSANGGYGGIWKLAQKNGSSPLGVDVVRDQGITVKSENPQYPCLWQSELVDCASGVGTSGQGVSGNNFITTSAVSLRDRSGATHPLLFVGQNLSGSNSPTLISQDGSGWLPQAQSGSAILSSVIDRNGLKYTPSAVSQNRQGWNITDTHGNAITTTDSGWTDSVGRTIPGTWPPDLIEDDPLPGVPTSDLSSCASGANSARIWNVPGK